MKKLLLFAFPIIILIGIAAWVRERRYLGFYISIDERLSGYL